MVCCWASSRLVRAVTAPLLFKVFSAVASSHCTPQSWASDVKGDAEHHGASSARVQDGEGGVAAMGSGSAPSSASTSLSAHRCLARLAVRCTARAETWALSPIVRLAALRDEAKCTSCPITLQCY